jgi:2-aminoadipate transaminase
MDDGMSPFAARVGQLRSSTLRDLVAAASASDTQHVLSLAGGLPPAQALPVDALHAAVERVLAAGGDALQYCPTEGVGDLLDLIAADLQTRLGIPEPRGRMVITAGSQQALDLIGKVLLDPGDVAVVEHPGYVGALRAFAAYQPRFVGVPVDDGGIDTAQLAEMLDAGLRPKLCYLVPNFSNPSGATLCAQRRVHLAELSARHGFLVVEDDPYGQLRFTGEALPPIATIGGQVAYLGSFSKVIAPGLRVGYAVVPNWLVRPLVVAKQAADLNSSTFAQRLVAEILKDQAFINAHVAMLVDLYRERAQALLAAVERVLRGRLRARVPVGGMFSWASIEARGVDAIALCRAAMTRGVALVPGNEFTVDGGFPADVRLSFAMLDPDEITEAVTRVGAALDDLAVR